MLGVLPAHLPLVMDAGSVLVGTPVFSQLLDALPQHDVENEAPAATSFMQGVEAIDTNLPEFLFNLFTFLILPIPTRHCKRKTVYSTLFE